MFQEKQLSLKTLSRIGSDASFEVDGGYTKYTKNTHFKSTAEDIEDSEDIEQNSIKPYQTKKQ